MIGNNIADKITSISKKPVKELHNDSNNNDDEIELTTNKEKYISPKEKQQIIDELRLEPI